MTLAAIQASLTAVQGFKKLKRLRKAPSQFRDLENEIIKYKPILLELDALLQMQAEQSSLSESFTYSLLPCAERTKRDLADLETLALSVLSPKNGRGIFRVKRTLWMWKEHEIEKLRKRLESSRHDLMLSISLASAHSIKRIENSHCKRDNIPDGESHFIKPSKSDLGCHMVQRRSHVRPPEVLRPPRTTVSQESDSAQVNTLSHRPRHDLSTAQLMFGLSPGFDRVEILARSRNAIPHVQSLLQGISYSSYLASMQTLSKQFMNLGKFFSLPTVVPLTLLPHDFHSRLPIPRADPRKSSLQMTLFWGWLVTLLLKLCRLASPERPLKIQNIRPPNDSIFFFARMGFVEEIKKLLLTGRASLLDVEHPNHKSALYVSDCMELEANSR